MPELVEINLVLEDDKKMKFVLTLLRFFSLRNEIVKVIRIILKKKEISR